MFIKNKQPKDFIGCKVETTRDIVVIKGTLTKGSLVLVTGVSSRGFDLKDIESGEDFIECDFDCI